MSHTTPTHEPPAEHVGEPPVSWKALLTAFSMPVVFVLVFAGTMVTAFHDPQPNDMAVTMAGPTAVTEPIVAGFEKGAPGAFDITQTQDTAAAKDLVAQRETTGAIVLAGSAESITVTTYVASGGGRGPAGAVQSIGDQITEQTGTTAEVVEVAPLASQDPLGGSLFNVLIYMTLGGFLALVVLTQLAPGTSLAVKYGVAGAAAALIPITVFGLSSIFLDGFDIGFDQLLGVLGVGGLYVLTVALIVIVSEQLLGKAALLAVVPITIFINLACAGGGTPVSMLPDFWQGVGSFWFGNGGMRALQDVVYFPDADPTGSIVKVLLWTLALVAISLLLQARSTIRRQSDQLLGPSPTAVAA